jgi:hypothetical protein
MHPLSAAELLSVWEQGQAALPVQRGLALLAVALPGWTPEALASLSIGRRDALLLRLRQETFGPQLISLAVCPMCAEKLELALPVSSLLLPAAAAGVGDGPDAFADGRIIADEGSLEDEQALASERIFIVKSNGYRVRFRLPNSLDLLELASGLSAPILESIATDKAFEDEGNIADKGEAGGRLLLERCLLAVSHQGRDLERPLSPRLPTEATNRVLKKMEEADQQASLALKLCCPACRHEWEAGFDTLSFFWIEIQAWARRILQEVHTLALAYGWREGDILAMSALRRQTYLEMLGR